MSLYTIQHDCDVLDNIESDVPTMLVHLIALALFVRSQHRDTNELLLVH